MTHTNTIDTSDWLATRDDLHQVREDHKANMVAVAGLVLGAMVLFGYAHGIPGFLYSVAVAVVVVAGFTQLNRIVTARTAKTYAPLADVVAATISRDLTIGELSTLIATDRVVVGKTLVRANVSKRRVTVTEQEYRFHDDIENVSATRARAEISTSYLKPFV